MADNLDLLQIIVTATCGFPDGVSGIVREYSMTRDELLKSYFLEFLLSRGPEPILTQQEQRKMRKKRKEPNGVKLSSLSIRCDNGKPTISVAVIDEYYAGPQMDDYTDITNYPIEHIPLLMGVFLDVLMKSVSWPEEDVQEGAVSVDFCNILREFIGWLNQPNHQTHEILVFETDFYSNKPCPSQAGKFPMPLGNLFDSKCFADMDGETFGCGEKLDDDPHSTHLPDGWVLYLAKQYNNYNNYAWFIG